MAGVREGLKQRMMEVKWLDEETRKLSIEKVIINALFLRGHVTPLQFR